MAEPMTGHRSAEMRGLIHALDPHLETLFGVAGPSHRVAVHSCTREGSTIFDCIIPPVQRERDPFFFVLYVFALTWYECSVTKGERHF